MTKGEQVASSILSMFEVMADMFSDPNASDKYKQYLQAEFVRHAEELAKNIDDVLVKP